MTVAIDGTDLLETSDVMRALRESRSAVERLVRDGALEPLLTTRSGRALFAESDVARLARERAAARRQERDR